MSKEVEQAQAAFDAAEAAYRSELANFCNRSDGSDRQERMADERLETAQRNVDDKKRDLDAAKKKQQQQGK